MPFVNGINGSSSAASVASLASTGAITQGGVAVLLAGQTHSLVGPWAGTNMAASQANAETLSIAGLGGAASDQDWFPQRAVSLTGMSLTLSSVASHVGTLTVSVFVDGVDAGVGYDLVCDPPATGDQGFFVTFATPLAVTAGQAVSLRVTTSADWSATTSDPAVFLEMTT